MGKTSEGNCPRCRERARVARESIGASARRSHALQAPQLLVNTMGRKERAVKAAAHAMAMELDSEMTERRTGDGQFYV